MKFTTIAIVFIVFVFTCKSQEKLTDKQLIKESITYKKIGDTFLNLDLFTSTEKEKKPVIVFFPSEWMDFRFTYIFSKKNTRIFIIRISYNLKTTTPKDCLFDIKLRKQKLLRTMYKINQG